MSEWVRHDGKKTPPLADETPLEVMYSDGHTTDTATVGTVKSLYGGPNNFEWERPGPWDVVAYRTR